MNLTVCLFSPSGTPQGPCHRESPVPLPPWTRHTWTVPQLPSFSRGPLCPPSLSPWHAHFRAPPAPLFQAKPESDPTLMRIPQAGGRFLLRTPWCTSCPGDLVPGFPTLEGRAHTLALRVQVLAWDPPSPGLRAPALGPDPRLPRE